jgi:ADP-ribose pyrophosphatase
LEIPHVEQLTNERWLNLFAAEFRHNGHTGRWVYASRHCDRAMQTALKADAVLVVAVLHGAAEPPRLVMVREFRVPIGDYVYGLPAGLLEAGESAEETARRELREETGFEVTRVKRVTPPLYSSCGITDEAAVLVFVDAHAVPGAQTQHEHGEEIEVVLLDHAAVCRLCDEPAIRIDAKAWSALYLYQQLGHFT